MNATSDLRTRLLGAQVVASERVLAWVGPVVVMVVGGVLRFWRLDRPHQLVFDETYYVKGAFSLLHWGYERRNDPALGKTPDAYFTNGTPNVFVEEGDKVVHGPIGKWVIAMGQWIFGPYSSFGWRFSVALLGTLSILMVGRIAWRMFHSATLATFASVLLAFEGHHFVQSRTGLLDLVLMFLVLAAFQVLLIDRDHTRARMLRLVAEPDGRPRLDGMRYGPFLGWHPLRLLAGGILGLACATKWSGMYYLAVFGLMLVLWEVGARHTAGVRRPLAGAMVKDAPLAFVTLVGSAVVTYTASWFGWFRSEGGYSRRWLENQDVLAVPATRGTSAWVPTMVDNAKVLDVVNDGTSWLPNVVRNFLHYHVEMWDFHVALSSPHSYQSNPWGWTLQTRPTAFFSETKPQGVEGCQVADCLKVINPIGSPAVWWAGTVMIFVALFMWVLHRDWRAGAALVGLAAGWLPWFQYQGRTVYTFYTVAFVPWMVLLVVYGAALVIGGPGASPGRHRYGTAAVWGFATLAVMLFAFFYPIYTAEVIPRAEWNARMWFPSWS